MTVRAAERALDILLCFVDQSELGLTEIAHRTSINKSTVFRLLATLESKGFVVRNPDTEKYKLGFRVWELAANMDHSDDPAVLFLPEMERLRDQVDETVSLYIRDGLERIRVQAVESKQTIRRVAPIGARMPLSVGASSKVLVAYSDPLVRKEVLNDPNWPPSVEQERYQKQLEEIRETGYAISVEEREAGTSAIAVPIFNRKGQIVAALAVSGPVGRWTPDRMKLFAPLITAAAKRMGNMLRK